MKFIASRSVKPLSASGRSGPNSQHCISKICFFMIFLSYSATVQSQQAFNDSIANSRNRITKTAMITLGSWAAVNITTGFIVAGQTQGVAKYFWKMNAYFNTPHSNNHVNKIKYANKTMS